MKTVCAARAPGLERKPAPDLVVDAPAVEKGHVCIETRQICVSRQCVAHLGGSVPQAVAALRDAVLHVVKGTPRPLGGTRAILAENRHRAIHAAQRGPR